MRGSKELVDHHSYSPIVVVIEQPVLLSDIKIASITITSCYSIIMRTCEGRAFFVIMFIEVLVAYQSGKEGEVITKENEIYIT